MAKTVKFSEAKQRNIAKETTRDTLLSVATKYGITTGTVTYYRRKFGVKATCGKVRQSAKKKEAGIITGLHPLLMLMAVVR